MKKIMQMGVVALFAAVEIGCVSDPFIEDCVAKLDANPVSVESRFGLPQTPQLPISPLSSDMLAGTWETGIQHPVHRHVGKDGTIVDFDKPGKFFHDSYKNFGFNPDGTYQHVDICRMATMSWALKKEGTWTYESGKLTLCETKMSMEYLDYALKALGVPNWQTQTTSTLNNILIYDVVWYAHDEISIMNEAEPKKQKRTALSHKSVSLDDYGVRLERNYNISGKRDGKEIGTVSEEIHPPMHYKKKVE